MIKTKLVKISLLSFLILTVCHPSFSKMEKFESKWGVLSVEIDGLRDDWSGDVLKFEKKVAIDYAFKNDSDYLYVLFIFKDPKFLSSINQTGMTLWFNVEGKKEKNYGIKFQRKMVTAEVLISLLEKKFGPLPEEKKKEIKSKPTYMLNLNEVIDEKSRISGVSAGPSASVFKSMRGKNMMTYEFRIPLRRLEGQSAGIGTEQGKKVGFEWGGMTKEMTFIATNKQGYKEYRHKQTGMVFVLIPGGTFRMGSPPSEKGRFGGNEGPVHEVTLNSFLISKYEVTQGVWQKIMGNNPSHFKKGDDYPVEQVSWNDCQEFCRKTGLRLPTEAEWEYACRAGITTRFYWGDEVNGDYMWYRDNAGGTTHPVGQKQPNDFGLYDMSGNVWEWCQDRYDHDYYKNSPKNNPKGPESGKDRPLRGGQARLGEDFCRSAIRFWQSPEMRLSSAGLRYVQDLSE